MKLAGEAGSLLRIEEEIAGAIAEAKQKWLAGTEARTRPPLCRRHAPPAQKELRPRPHRHHRRKVLGKGRAADLRRAQAYAEQAENGGGYQRRLFADDAAQGFAFIDLCRKRYDVVVMNPPFRRADSKTAIENIEQRIIQRLKDNMSMRIHQAMA